MFRALYAEYDLRTLGVLHVVTPKGTPVFISESLGQIARRLSDHEEPALTSHPARPGGSSVAALPPSRSGPDPVP